VVASKADLSQEPKFTEAMAHKVYYGPVYLRRQSDIYMTLSLAGTRREAGVSVAEVSLWPVWELIRQLKVGAHGVAYVLDAQDRVIAHSAMFTPPLDGERASYHVDVTLLQRDLSGLAQVQAARARWDAAGRRADGSC
jgi:two-component system, NtrC family, sensor kinase